MSTDILKKAVRKALRQILIEQNQESAPKDSAEPKNTQPTSPTKKDKDAGTSTPPKRKKAPPKRKKSNAAPGSVGIAQGAFGSGGRYSKATTEAGARAQKDPKGLMRDLGVKESAPGLQGVLDVMNAAIHSNDIMGQAYVGATISQEQSPDGTMVKVIGITNSGLNHRNALKFLSHTLIGAQNAGLLSLPKAIEINRGRNTPIIVYEV
jgi:hypothetical protein